MVLKNAFYKWVIIIVLICFAISGIFSLYLKNNDVFTFNVYPDEKAQEDFVFCNTAGIWLENMIRCDHFYLEYLPNRTSDVSVVLEIPNLGSKQIISNYKSVQIWRKSYGKDPYPALIDLTNGQLNEEMDLKDINNDKKSAKN
ncbi:hypothetical protein EU510_02110 [Pseudoalteromonas sp. FUC4]|uniref:hypothetical protein n=1 Tax=Pseudoalteromonas sp. FUC4 TaxID=2511201 RepID=UPI0011F3D3E5|nr:hypothetical protein [Pseudoalteromonas sp. FUC4]KAA1154926.1 hypothetical protein EU510_02110 [Pseudoalteromonas sp. FUC4]